MTKRYDKDVYLSMLDAMEELDKSQFSWNAEYGKTKVSREDFAEYVSSALERTGKSKLNFDPWSVAAGAQKWVMPDEANCYSMLDEKYNRPT